MAGTRPKVLLVESKLMAGWRLKVLLMVESKLMAALRPKVLLMVGS